jgi:hypothetical protein
MPTQEELHKQLVTFMTTEEPSKAGVMHGGTFGYGKAARDALAGQVAGVIADLFPNGIRAEDAAKVQQQLATALTGDRATFVERFEGVGDEESKKSTRLGFANAMLGDVKPTKLESVTPEREATHQALVAHLSGKGVKDHAVVATELMNSSSGPTADAVAAVIVPKSTQVAEAEQKYTELLAVQKEMKEPATYVAALQKLSVSEDEAKIFLAAERGALFARNAQETPLDPNALEAELKGKTAAEQYAILKPIQKQAGEGENAYIDHLVSEAVKSSGKLETELTASVEAAKQKGEDAKTKLTADISRAEQVVEEHTQAVSQAKQEWQAKAEAAVKPLQKAKVDTLAQQQRVAEAKAAMARAVTQRQQQEQQQAQQRAAAQQQAQQRAVAEQQAQQQAQQRAAAKQQAERDLIENVKAFRANLEGATALAETYRREMQAFESAKQKDPKVVKSEAYNRAEQQYTEHFQGHVEAYVTRLMDRNVAVSLTQHDQLLQQAPREVQRAVLEAVGKKLDPNATSLLHKWHAERSVAVENGVQFNPELRTNVEKRFMDAKVKEQELYQQALELNLQVLKEKEDGKGGVGSSLQKALDDVGKRYNAAVKASASEKKTLEMEQQARQRLAAQTTQVAVPADPGKAADQRLADATKARSSYVDYLPRYSEIRSAVQERVGGLGLVQTAKDRLENARKLTELAETMQQDAGAINRDLYAKNTQLLGREDQPGTRGRIAALQPQAMRQSVRAKVVQDILEAKNPPFFQGMDQKQTKTFYDAVEKQTNKELDQLKKVHKELNAGSLLQTDAITKMERAHKALITIRDKDLQKLQVRARDLEHHNEAIAEKDAALKKARGLDKLAPEEQVKLVVAVGKCAALGLYEKDNENKFQQALDVLPDAEKKNLLRFKQKCDLNKEVGKHLEQQGELQRLYAEAKTLNKPTANLEDQMAANKAVYGEKLNTLGKLLAEEHEATTKAVEQQKEAVTVSGKFQRWFNDNVKSGTFAEGEKVLNARKLKDLETQQAQLNKDFAKVTKMADQHRNTYLDAKSDYEKAATKVEQQLQTAEKATAQYRKAGEQLGAERPGKPTQLVEAMHLVERVDAEKGAVLAKAGHGQSQALVGSFNPEDLLTGATKGSKTPPKTVGAARGAAPQTSRIQGGGLGF